MRRSLILLLLPIGLLAQETFTMTTRSFGGDSISLLPSSRQPTLVVLDDGKNGWTPLFRKLLTEQPLVDWSFGSQFLNGKADDKRSTELRTQFGWGAGARWAFLVNGAVKASGTTLPTATTLATSLQGAGFQDPTQALAAFCARHPDHVEAQAQLLEAYLSRAQRYMRRVLPPPAETGASRISIMMGGLSATTGMAEAEPTRALTAAEDKQFWGPAEQQLRRLMRHPSWFVPSTGLEVPALARHSALMKEACRASLGAVEERLRTYPGHDALWRTWASMARTADNRRLRALVGALEAVPGSKDLPPDAALDLYVKECREVQAWGEMKDVLLPRWRAFRGTMAMVQGMLRDFRSGADDRDAFKETWDRTLEPLVEACLRGGDGGTADAVVEEALQTFQAKNLPIWASALALKCGQVPAAQRWAALKVPEAAR